MFRDGRRRGRTLLIGVVAIAWAGSLAGAPYPKDQALQHVPTVLILAALFRYRDHRGLRTATLCCLLGFLLLHIVGARWVYSYVPYDQWAADMIGRPLSSVFGWQRNHYDRLVHFMFGVLIVTPTFDLLRPHVRSGVIVAALVFLLITAAGGLYEIFEWLLTVVMSDEAARNYNGQQGDLWDAQKDMALACVGAVPGTIYYAFRSSAADSP